MVLRIPVYKQDLKEAVQPKPTLVDKTIEKYIVKPKETKWRIAYNFKMTVPELEAINPKIKAGLKAGQEILVPVMPAQSVSQT